MERLEEIDRQLAELGTQTADLRAAIERVLGQDRSLAKIDEILSGLGEVPPGMLTPRVPSSRPPRRSSSRTGSSRSTLVSIGAAPEAEPPVAAVVARPAPAPAPALALELASEPERAAALEPVPEPVSPAHEVVAPASSWPPRAPRSSLPPRIVTPQPLLSSPVPSVAAPSPWPPRPASSPRITDTLVDTPLEPLPPISSSDDDLDAETSALLGGPPSMPSAVPLPFGPSVETGLSAGETPTRVGPPPGEIEAAAAEVEQERERRDSVRALLDQEIDPNDFPSERPPRLQKPDDDGVEMLLEDDEILEIEDDELLEDEN